MLIKKHKTIAEINSSDGNQSVVKEFSEGGLIVCKTQDGNFGVYQYHEGDNEAYFKLLLSCFELKPVIEYAEKQEKEQMRQWIRNEERMILSRINTMCQESLNPEKFDMWEDVMYALIQTRKAFK